jgi:prephenate dehydrogenase
MHFPERLSECRVAIYGLGLIGGSLAFALRGKSSYLAGVDHDPGILELARNSKLFDQLSSEPETVLPQCNLIILALPIHTIISVLQQIELFHPGFAILLDLGSTKRAIAEIMDHLPSRFISFGGHPMCGKELSGFANADESLFKGAKFAVTPPSHENDSARLIIQQLIQSIGSELLWIDPDVHDRWVARSSHLPFILATALAASTPSEVAPLIGPGYRSTSRLAMSSPVMMRDILSTNKDNIIEALISFKNELTQIENLLVKDQYAQLERVFSQNAEHQKDLIS